MSDVLLTFVGMQDPFNKDGEPGPILSLLSARRFDKVIVLHTPSTQQNVEKTLATLRKTVPVLDSVFLPISDPTDYREIALCLKNEVLPRMNSSGEHYFIASASGTPAMLGCWVALIARGKLKADLAYVVPKHYKGEGIGEYRIYNLDEIFALLG